MNKIILFTPIGGTDPISSTNCCDGSMLHICRHYKPDKVIMYMSKEMLDYQEKDDRYRYCLKRLSGLLNHKMEYEIIERRELTKVHEFDFFYNDFRMIIEKIYERIDQSDRLLLNISSGTPAMKSGLLVLQTLGEFPAKTIQVATPEGKINEHIHRDYDVAALWELNEDNQKGAKNRCKEVECPSLSKIKKEEIIKKHIQVYDYRAALGVAETMPDEDTILYKDLLSLATGRSILDFAGVDKIIRKTGFQCLPVRTSSERKYFEYALNIDLKLRRQEYADFIRAITPIVVDLFEAILKKQARLNVDDYCIYKMKDGNLERHWSIRKMKGTKVEEIFNMKYKPFRENPVSSHHLVNLIEYLVKYPHLVQLSKNVRKIESHVRNLAAHQIVSITDEVIIEKTGFSAQKIMDMIKELFDYTGMNIKPNYWNSYDDMNKKILEIMSVEK